MILRLCFLTCCTACGFAAAAQPYIDLVNVRRLQSGLPGSNSGNMATISYNNVSTTIPLQFKNKDALILSPYYENWDLSLIDSGDYNVRGWVMPISFLRNIPNTRWAILPTFVARLNKESNAATSSPLQYGGAIIASYKHKPTLTYKLGLYYNKEFFGNFFIPLAGIDWRINEKNNVFGVLPGNMIWEHKVSKSFYYGAVFRAITNSYRVVSKRYGYPPGTKPYLRVDDNQLAAFADMYLFKNLVINAEVGHSIARKFRTGYKEAKTITYRTIYNKDNLFVKASIAYRIRLK